MKGTKLLREEDRAFPLPWFVRFYVYGIQGFADEIVFTAFFDIFALEERNWALHGTSSISSFFIYGALSFLMERIYLHLYYKHGVQRYVRIPLYVCLTYSWEFTSGSILRLFDACPWDYSHYPYNYKGLITLEYAPGWAFLAVIQDIMADFLLRVRMMPPGDARDARVLVLPPRDVTRAQIWRENDVKAPGKAEPHLKGDTEFIHAHYE